MFIDFDAGMIVDPTVSDIIDVLDRLAPQALAEEWDNVGLQVGDPRRRVKTIWIALDPIYPVVDAACRQKVDLLITHHPLIFKPLRSINVRSPQGSIIDLAVRHRLAIFAAHTNLDSALGGINDVLAERIKLFDLKPLAKAKEPQRFKLVIHAPRKAEQRITRLLDQTGSESNYRVNDTNCVMPVTTIAAAGDAGKLSGMDQLRIEISVGKDELASIKRALDDVTLDDRTWYDAYPLITPDQGRGIGRIGSLQTELELKSLALMIQKRLKLSHLKYAGDPALPVKKVAVCSGSGSSLLAAFFASDAQVYISGDLHYHDARDVEASNLGLIDIGHFSSEHLIVEALAERLASTFADSNMNLTVQACNFEKDPFKVL